MSADEDRQLLDLSFLDEEEKRQIEAVLKRSYEEIRKEENRLKCVFVWEEGEWIVSLCDRVCACVRVCVCVCACVREVTTICTLEPFTRTSSFSVHGMRWHPSLHLHSTPTSLAQHQQATRRHRFKE